MSIQLISSVTDLTPLLAIFLMGISSASPQASNFHSTLIHLTSATEMMGIRLEWLHVFIKMLILSKVYCKKITKYSEYRFIGVLDAKTLKTILF